MTIRLRAHHLLCLLTYMGKGYSPAFVENYDRIAKRLSDGEDIVMVEGPDDICAPISAAQDAHCHRDSVGDRDQKAAEDVGHLLGIPISTGVPVPNSPALFQRMRAGFASGQTRSACSGCEWSSLCTTVAAAGYDKVRVHGDGT